MNKTGGRRKMFITRQVDCAAAEHLLSPFSSLFFRVKWLYDNGFSGFISATKAADYHQCKRVQVGHAANAADLKLATCIGIGLARYCKCSGLGAAHWLNMKLDLQRCTHWLRHQPPPPPAPRVRAHIRGRHWSANIDDIYLWPVLKNNIIVAALTTEI